MTTDPFLIPYDADADDLRASGLSMEALQDYFGYITSRQLIFFLDCCYSGGAGGGRSFDVPGIKTRATLNADFLESLSNDARFIVTACGMNEVSLETTEIGHGLFTYFLVEGLKGKADADGDGLVTMDELYSFVCDNVERESKKLGGRMRPMRAGKASGDVYLTQYETEAQRRAKQANAEAGDAFDEGDLEAARRLWEECLQLAPGHDHAMEQLAVIAALNADARATALAAMADRQRALVALRRSGALQIDDYAQALELVESDPATLSAHLRELQSFAEALADKRITSSQYMKSVKYANANATPSQRAMPQPTLAKKMAAERKAGRANAPSVETVTPTSNIKIQMTPPVAAQSPPPTATPRLSTFTPPPKSSIASTIDVSEETPSLNSPRRAGSPVAERSKIDQSRGMLAFVLGLVLGFGFITTVDNPYAPFLTSALSVIGALYLGAKSERATTTRNGLLGGTSWTIATFGYIQFHEGRGLDSESAQIAALFVVGGLALAWIGYGVKRFRNRKKPS